LAIFLIVFSLCPSTDYVFINILGSMTNCVGNMRIGLQTNNQRLKAKVYQDYAPDLLNHCLRSKYVSR